MYSNQLSKRTLPMQMVSTAYQATYNTNNNVICRFEAWLPTHTLSIGGIRFMIFIRAMLYFVAYWRHYDVYELFTRCGYGTPRELAFYSRSSSLCRLAF